MSVVTLLRRARPVLLVLFLAASLAPWSTRPARAVSPADFVVGIVGNLVASAIYDAAGAGLQYAKGEISETKTTIAVLQQGTVNVDVGDIYNVKATIHWQHNGQAVVRKLEALVGDYSHVAQYDYKWRYKVDSSVYDPGYISPWFTVGSFPTTDAHDGSLTQTETVQLVATGIKGDCTSTATHTIVFESEVIASYISTGTPTTWSAYLLTYNPKDIPSSAQISLVVHNPFTVTLDKYPQGPFDHHTAAKGNLDYTLRHQSHFSLQGPGAAERDPVREGNFFTWIGASAHFRFPLVKDDKTSLLPGENADDKRIPLGNNSNSFSQPYVWNAFPTHHDPHADKSVSLRFNGIVKGKRRLTASDGTQGPAVEWSVVPHSIPGKCLPHTWSVKDRDGAPPGTTGGGSPTITPTVNFSTTTFIPAWTRTPTITPSATASRTPSPTATTAIAPPTATSTASATATPQKVGFHLQKNPTHVIGSFVLTSPVHTACGDASATSFNSEFDETVTDDEAAPDAAEEDDEDFDLNETSSGTHSHGKIASDGTFSVSNPNETFSGQIDSTGRGTGTYVFMRQTCSFTYSFTFTPA